jgi:hypothetical protein
MRIVRVRPVVGQGGVVRTGRARIQHGEVPGDLANSRSTTYVATRSRCSHTLRKWSPPVSLIPFYPRGNPLTESMPFLASDGAHWLAYIEGVPSDPPPWPWRQVVLPGRRLRFDSANESRVTSRLPAGSPFLTDGRLQSLLDEAQLVPPPAASPSSRSRDFIFLRQPVIEWVTRVAEGGRARSADWSRQWRRGASQRQVVRRRVLGLVPAASNTLHLAIETVLGRRRARP